MRQGFFTEDEYKLLRAALPDHVKVPLIIAYWTGMRAGEIVMLRWEQIDLERGLLRLEPGTTKNNQGQTLPLVKEVTEHCGSGNKERYSAIRPVRGSAISEARDWSAFLRTCGRKRVSV